jgi:hypothetical protein
MKQKKIIRKTLEQRNIVDYSWPMFVNILLSVMRDMKSSGFMPTDDFEFNVSRNPLMENAFRSEIIVCIAREYLLEFYGCLDSNLL